MNYYTNACEQLEGAELLAASGKYRLAVTLLCLSSELFLKSLAEYIDPKSPLLDSHDIVGLGYLIRNDIDYKNLTPKLRLMRKYLNDSRYPFDLISSSLQNKT
ncbi:MAG: HEPN domain-containing protein [Treponema sp.]|jgi:HEPN domain-containing protein|nr:HEPN domain-containing protein [Treponema sp.]